MDRGRNGGRARGRSDGSEQGSGPGRRPRRRERGGGHLLAGKARGGGAELVAAADLAFAAKETAGLGQVAALMGITPGGGDTQYLLDRVGRNRALELVLAGEGLRGRAHRGERRVGVTGPGPAARRLMSDALKAGAQTVQSERELEGLVRGVA
ncbi:enoyl-CoA hydratase-related protein [Lentzea sp. NPDC102401]|uniref:enoyl-CoA hydratase-related protein n=1 Tax=Lentzea sp. NPDC102401 TaxID=3364128 RepID=UPI0038243F9B